MDPGGVMSHTPLQRHIRHKAVENGIDIDIMDAADHRADCRCKKCWKFWRSTVGGADTMLDFWDYCPFTEEELRNGRRWQNDRASK
jgi:hypothetical protein